MQEGFAEYLDTATIAARRDPNSTDAAANPPSLWIAAGVMAVGALAALTFKNAFS